MQKCNKNPRKVTQFRRNDTVCYIYFFEHGY